MFFFLNSSKGMDKTETLSKPAVSAFLSVFVLLILRNPIQIREFLQVPYLPFFILWSKKGFHSLFQSYLSVVFFVILVVSPSISFYEVFPPELLKNFDKLLAE